MRTLSATGSDRNIPRALIASTVPITALKFYGELVRQVQDQGFDVCIVSSPGPEMNSIRSDMNARVCQIPMSRKISPIADLAALMRWLRVCVIERPELILAATPKASLLALIAGMVTGVPRRIYSLVGLRLESEEGIKRHVLVSAERVTSWASTEVVANSSSLAKKYAELGLAPKRKLRQTMPGSDHGVDSDYFSPRRPNVGMAERLGIDDSLPVIGFVGRLTHDKGIDALLDALTRLHAEGISCQLLVVGPQDEADSSAYISKLGKLKNRVFTVGPVANVRPYFALMDVHVLPSLREGFPNVVLEASAMGLPTITTDATGAVDSVRDGETGMLVRRGDPLTLATALRTLLRDPERASRYGQAARIWVVEGFQPKAIVQTLLAFDDAPASSRTRNNREAL